MEMVALEDTASILRLKMERRNTLSDAENFEIERSEIAAIEHLPPLPAKFLLHQLKRVKYNVGLPAGAGPGMIMGSMGDPGGMPTMLVLSERKLCTLC